MKTYKQLLESLETDVLDILISSGIDTSTVDYCEGCMSGEIYDSDTLDMIISSLPSEADYEVFVSEDELVSEQDDFEYIDYTRDESGYILIIYLNNTDYTDGYVEESLSEGAPKKKTAYRKGKKVIKWQCKKNEKFDGTTCVKMSAAERRNKKLGAIKAARKRKSTGNKSNKMRALSLKKRKSSGV